jgi:beta-N-acetylhexosaminidase
MPVVPPAQPTLREKLGQLLNVGFRGSRPADCALIVRDVREHHVGAVVLFDQEMADGSARRRNIESPDQVRELLAFLQSHATVPLLTSIDQEGGRVNRLKPDYGFPPSVSHEELGRLDQPDETYRRAAQTAATLHSVGLNWNLAPVVDLDAQPDNPIIKGKRRSFSADPEAVARHAAAFVRAHRDRGVLTCAKHFPGHGSARGDTHLGLVDVTATWHERELLPFQRLIEAGLCDAIMSAHVFNAALDPDRPATLSRAVITGLLRERLGFDGVISSDDLEMRAISSQYGLGNSVPLAIEAGLDLLCFGNNLTYDPDIVPRVLAILERAVTTGRLSEARIDASYRRVLALKRRAGLVL